jgi:DNA ligase-1
LKEFAALYAAIDETNKTNEKVSAMTQFFESAAPEDAAWAVHFLIGRRPKRLLSSSKLFSWAAQLACIPEWLFSECYDAVGDLAETIALALPDYEVSKSAHSGLSYWVTERLLPLATMDEDQQHQAMVDAWSEMDRRERFAWNKLITGAFRVGVSQELVTRALARALNVPAPVIAHRLMGDWTPTAEFFESLRADESAETEISKPYPFCLAHPLEGGPESLGDPSDSHIEWKWDGIRAQVIRRGGQSFIWSRGEELITDRFPEILGVAESLPDGTVLDGEILAWAGGKPLKFLELQKRIGRTTLTKKILQEVPVVLVAFDLLEVAGQDVRLRPLSERRRLLETVVKEANDPGEYPTDFAALLGMKRAAKANFDRPAEVKSILAGDAATDPQGEVIRTESRLLISSAVTGADWEEISRTRDQARDLNVEGFMIKRLDAPYQLGRKKGVWWKWKIEPLTVDAVLIYAARGSGKRASLYTDYTFGIWSEGKLVSFAKAYSGLNDEEIREVDRFVRNHTLEKFGPVRTVTPELVFELAFEAIQLSSRHKSGIAVRFPRILRWRHDKKAADADTLESVKQLL